MKGDTLVQLTAAACMALFAGSSLLMTQGVASSVGRNALVYTEAAEEGTPKEVAVGIAMGAFRGLFVNMLWMRAQKAKDAGNYYEAIDLARTITKLQPRFPRVWAFHAWNMAYNISVTTNTNFERWQWVGNGIRLLRDEGIPANPNDLLLHRELAWIFLHKVQGYMDDANPFYKRALAEEWTTILGPPRPADPSKSERVARTREEAQDDAIALLEKIKQAPETLERIVELQPAAKDLLAALGEIGLDLRRPEDQMRFLHTVEVRRSLLRLGTALPSVRPNFESDAVMKLLNQPNLTPAWELIVPHVRKRVLTDSYHMEIDRMQKYTNKYGPLDWRHPATHALYWATRGVDESLQRVDDRNRGDYDFLNTDRVVVQAIQEIYRYGDIQFDILRPANFFAMPNPWFIPTYRAVLDDLIEREIVQLGHTGAKVEQRPFNLYAAGYENFMKDAICFLYRRGEKDEARKYQVQLLADFRRGLLNKNDYDLESQLEMPLDSFVVEQLRDRLTTPNIAQAEVGGALYGSFIYGLLKGQNELFRSQFDYAKAFHTQYMNEQYRNTGVDEKGRLELMPRDFRECVAQFFIGCVQKVGVEDGAIMYSRAPADIRQWSYDLLVEYVKPEVDELSKSGRSPAFATLFSEPEGVELARIERAKAGVKPREADKVLK